MLMVVLGSILYEAFFLGFLKIASLVNYYQFNIDPFYYIAHRFPILLVVHLIVALVSYPFFTWISNKLSYYEFHMLGKIKS